METLYGESPEIQVEDGYYASGRIASYSTNDIDDEGTTITGGSGDSGSYPSSSRIYWTITRVADPAVPDGYRYSGGINNVSWFSEMWQSPFYGYTEADIWRVASGDGNLNSIFNEWNNDLDPNVGEEKRAYFMYYLSVHAKGCSRTTTS